MYPICFEFRFSLIHDPTPHCNIHVVKVTSNKCFSSPTGSVDMDKVHYCERFLELLVDLEVLSNFNYVVRHS